MDLPRKLRVGVISSVGGHLAEALELWPELAPYDSFLVVNDETPWRAELPFARRYRIVHAERDARLLLNLVEATRILRAERPDVLISLGASPAVPFFALGRLLGIETIFIESFAAVENATLTGRILHPIARHFFVQWPELLQKLPRARYVGPIFGVESANPLPFDANKLLVTVGSSARPFTRLFDWLDALGDRSRLPATRVVQGSVGDRSWRHFRAVPYLPAETLETELRTAGVIICHGGSGVLGACLKWGRHPLVVPRRAALSEVVNDHQLMLCRALAARGLLTVCESAAELDSAIEKAREKMPSVAQKLPSELRPAVAAILAAAALRLTRTSARVQPAG